MNDQSKRARGRWGEDLAAGWYLQRGCQVLARNWRCVDGEIDLVVADGEQIVIVEVKARRDDRYGSPVLAVDARKQHRLRRLAIRWLAAERPDQRVDLRFDVVAVTGSRVEVIEAAF